jgi:hypothetical protein
MVKPEPKFLSWQCLLLGISFIPDHEFFFMIIEFSLPFWLELALVHSLLGDYDANGAKMVLAAMIIFK